MKLTNNAGKILLGSYLILLGVLPQFNIPYRVLGVVLGIVSLAAGVVLLLQMPRGNYLRNLGIILLSTWLVLEGIVTILNFYFPAEDIVLSVLAIAAGVVLLTGWPAGLGFSRSVGIILLSVWLVLEGLLIVVSFPTEGYVLVLLAIAAGILIILDQ